MDMNDKTLETQIKMMCAAAGISLAELARRTGDTPQKLNQRLKTGKMQSVLDMLGDMAAAAGFQFVYEFREIGEDEKKV